MIHTESDTGTVRNRNRETKTERENGQRQTARGSMTDSRNATTPSGIAGGKTLRARHREAAVTCVETIKTY